MRTDFPSSKAARPNKYEKTPNLTFSRSIFLIVSMQKINSAEQWNLEGRLT